MSLRATLYLDRDKHRADKVPGSVWFTDAKRDRVASMWFYCPCGCGLLQRITVGVEHKPDTTPSWKWDGNEENPTLRPSVNIRANDICPGWHGWLRGGYWEVC